MNWTLIANTIRGLVMDAVQRARSGHPGMPMGVADFASVLFLKYLKHNPANPSWINRDRYVQSAGHGSMLLYSLLHLCGYDVSLEDLKQFRQWGSKTPGHPEFGHTPGVETTTGPLGQGCGNAVGMAVAEAMLAARFNREGFPIIDHRTFVIASDGDLMEGVSYEAFSLAGHWGLNKLIVFYDANRITIDGSTDLTFTEDVRKRFEAWGWEVFEIDGHDYLQIDDALSKATRSEKAPVLIIGHTHIGKGSPNKQDTPACHGAPLGEEEVRLTKRALGLPEDQEFWIPEEVRDVFRAAQTQWAAAEQQWQKLKEEYERAYPELARELERWFSGMLPEELDSLLDSLQFDKAVATRKVSGMVLQRLRAAMPNLVGGSADLGESTHTLFKDEVPFSRSNRMGRNFYFGIREHAMCAILNGMACHGGLRVYGGTFLVFSDYCRPAIRMAAMMGLPVIYVFTHDSIFLGEDGPTHQPIEHLAGLRCIPNLTVLRPADAAETLEAWKVALRNLSGPTALILTRQEVPVLDRSVLAPACGVQQGAYVLWQTCDADPELIIIATGSELAPALAAGRRLADQGVKVRVVSMPSRELFELQSAELKEAVLPSSCRKRLVVEAACPFGWDRYVGCEGAIVGIRRFGASAPERVLAIKFGFTTDQIFEVAISLMRANT